MKACKQVLFFFFLVIFQQQAVAQQVSGHWFGVGKVMVTGEHNAYLSELILKQKGKNVSGELQYYFRDSLFKVPVSGTYTGATRQLNLKPIPFIYYLSGSTKNGIDCFLAGKFTLIVNRTESILNGAFESDAAHRYTSPSIQFRFRYSTDTATIRKLDIVLDEPEAKETDSISTEVLTKKDTVITKPIDTLFKAREKVFIREIEVTSNQLRLELYDNGSIDYDSVSLYLNDQTILPKVKLDHRAIRKVIVLDSTRAFNELSMFAENLGMVPPNTAALILYDGDKRYELILTSDLNTTATIRIRRRKE